MRLTALIPLDFFRGGGSGSLTKPPPEPFDAQKSFELDLPCIEWLVSSELPTEAARVTRLSTTEAQQKPLELPC